MPKQKTAVEPSHFEQAKVWSGPESMNGLLVPLDSLRLDLKNARQHDERGIKAVEKSLKAFGQRKPIVVRDGVVVAGNGTLLAAQRLTWSHIAVVTADDLTPQQVTAYAIADNRTAELSEWNFENLASYLKALPDDLLGSVGFEPFELEPLMQANFFPVLPDDGDFPAGAKSHSLVFSPDQWALIEKARTRIDGIGNFKATPLADVVMRACQSFVDGSPQ